MIILIGKIDSRIYTGGVSRPYIMLDLVSYTAVIYDNIECVPFAFRPVWVVRQDIISPEDGERCSLHFAFGYNHPPHQPMFQHSFMDFSVMERFKIINVVYGVNHAENQGFWQVNMLMG